MINWLLIWCIWSLVGLWVVNRYGSDEAGPLLNNWYCAGMFLAMLPSLPVLAMLVALDKITGGAMKRLNNSLKLRRKADG